jgi:anti-sigma B factor antagonist
MSVIRTQEGRGFLVIEISGRLSVLDYKLKETVRQLLTAGHRQFILKMSDVSYLDSCGLGELVCIYTSVRNSGGSLRLLSPSERARKLLNTTKLDTVFDILDDATPFLDPTDWRSGPQLYDLNGR